MWRDILLNKDIRVVKIDGGDANHLSKHQKDLKRMVSMLDDSYPGIDSWFDKKVVPGLKDKERFAIVVYSKNRPVGMAIVKKGTDAKLCSMRINPEYQQKGIGKLLMALVGRSLINFSKEVHFTIPESIYLDKQSFFDRFGFVNHGENGYQYRMFDKEFCCSVPTAILWKNVLYNIGSIIEDFSIKGNQTYPDIVLSIKPEYALGITSGKKKIEIRRKFSKKWEGSYAMIYASEPVSSFIGEVKIDKIYENTPEVIWENFRKDIGVERSDFFEYCKGTDKVSALLLSEISPYKNRILKRSVEQLLSNDLVSPQSFSIIREDSPWPTAISLNYLIQA